MRTVTVRRGEKLPENMAAPWVETTILTPSLIALKPGDMLPPNCECGAITVEVPDDPPPQAYLIVPCEPGKGTHRIGNCGDVIYTATPEAAHQQIPCPLTLEDLRLIRGHLAGTGPKISPVTFELFGRLTATIAAWSAVPQAKEAGK